MKSKNNFLKIIAGIIGTAVVFVTIGFPTLPKQQNRKGDETLMSHYSEPDEPGLNEFYLTANTEDNKVACTEPKDPLSEMEYGEPAPTPTGGEGGHCRKCEDNRDGHLGNTLDKCIVAGRGNVCNGATKWEDQLCCDFTDSSKTKCECNTHVAGPCPHNNEACTCCMMLAEGGTENNDTCKQAIYCVMKARADDAGATICRANSMKVGKGDTASFTSDKCTCDRYGTGNGAYNQIYCDCREAICNNGGALSAWPGCQEMLKLANTANCDALGNPNTYQLGKCPKKCRQVGPSNCKHTFCAC